MHSCKEEKGTTEDEMAGWHHWPSGREFEWTPGLGDGQGGLKCCNSWGHKESDTTGRLNWTELNFINYSVFPFCFCAYPLRIQRNFVIVFYKAEFSISFFSIFFYFFAGTIYLLIQHDHWSRFTMTALKYVIILTFLSPFCWHFLIDFLSVSLTSSCFLQGWMIFN